jgi:hypothetical protein
VSSAGNSHSCSGSPENIPECVPGFDRTLVQIETVADISKPVFRHSRAEEVWASACRNKRTDNVGPYEAKATDNDHILALDAPKAVTRERCHREYML